MDSSVHDSFTSWIGLSPAAHESQEESV